MIELNSVASIDMASLEGVPGVTADFLGLSLDINQASGTADGTPTGTAAVALNWTTQIDTNDDLAFGDAVDPGAALPVPVDPQCLACVEARVTGRSSEADWSRWSVYSGRQERTCAIAASTASPGLS